MLDAYSMTIWMPGITAVLILGVVIGAGVGFLGKRRAVRVAGWCVCGFFAISMLLFVCMLPRLLQR